MVDIMFSLFMILALFSVADSCLGPNFGRKLLESPKLPEPPKLYSSPCEAIEIVTRDTWSDLKPSSKSSISGPVSHVFIHHTVTEQCFNEKWCKEELQGIQKGHIKRGFNDIGYSFLIGGDGVVYEGRGWNTVGAHTVGYNTQSYAISFIGNFMKELPDKLALKAAKRLIACGQEKNKIASSYDLHGHRDADVTACPGDKLYKHISSWPTFNNKQIVDGDKGCTEVFGVCKSDKKKCSGEQESGLCSGASSRICCIGSDKLCISKHGTCQDNSQSCNGEYQSSLCAGAASRQCCVPASADMTTPTMDSKTTITQPSQGSDTRCTSKHGNCQDKSQSCIGEYQSNLCAGAASRQCCVPASAEMTTPTMDPKTTVTQPPQGSPCNKVTIIPRSTWKARSSKSTSGLHTPVDMFFIHHTDGQPCDSISSCSGILRGIQNWHMDPRPDFTGWYDIGYSFLAGDDGNIYEGRGWDRVGSHTKDYNSKGLALSFMGNYEKDLPPDVAITASENLIECGIEMGKISSDYRLYGHRDVVSNTSCPGKALYAAIQNWPHYSSTGLDTPCTSKHGNCQDESHTCNGEYQSNLCGGAASRRCCVPAGAELATPTTDPKSTTMEPKTTVTQPSQSLDTPCTSKQGNCQDERDTCNGEYQSNLCVGTASRRCCVPASAELTSPTMDPKTTTMEPKTTVAQPSQNADLKCTHACGVCQSKDEGCSSHYKPGLCTGDSNRMCCIPKVSIEFTTPASTGTQSTQADSQLHLEQDELEKLKSTLIQDEDMKCVIYEDSMKNLTFGIGHLIVRGDPERGKEKGTLVTRERVEEAFRKDIQSVLTDVLIWSNDCNEWPAEVKQIISNMMFNLGLTRFDEFKRLKSAIKRRDWQDAANEMEDSIWAGQVKDRAVRLIERMRNVVD